MQINILWAGIEHHSLENCLLTPSPSGNSIDSVIVGKYGETLYKVEYTISTNENWETTFFELKTQFSDRKDALSYHSDGKGTWTRNGVPDDSLKGCIDIDISLTPFTNTLPVNRLNLSVNESKQIMVVYLDILERQVKPLHQVYTRLSETAYRYQNVVNGFNAVLTVDEAGLVVDYPGLFTRTGRLDSRY